jgi:1,3-beta-glucan synthase
MDYPLHKAPDARTGLSRSDAGSPSELLQYLVSEFPDEIRNLLERCRKLVSLSKDDPPYALVRQA